MRQEKPRQQRDDVLQRMLKTPPTPHKAKGEKWDKDAPADQAELDVDQPSGRGREGK